MMDVEIEAKRAEKNAEKVRARKNRKATYFCEKRHKKHLNYKTMRYVKDAKAGVIGKHHDTHRQVKRADDAISQKVAEYLCCNDTDSSIRPFYISEDDAAYREKLTKFIIENAYEYRWENEDNEGAVKSAEEMLSGLSLQELKLVAYVTGSNDVSRREISVVDAIGWDERLFTIYGRHLIDINEYCTEVLDILRLRWAYESLYYDKSNAC